ncbi:MAG: MFS transporter [Candidatus Paracaedibacteraceae bacterium]|nr:MFS transporter [Candidatus Paracaedibacteraceae bacterium]
MDISKAEIMHDSHSFSIEKDESSPIYYKKESLYACIVMLCAWSFYLYEYILRVSPGVLEKFLMQDYAITATTVGVISSAYYWAYTPLQLPCGVIVDHLGARRVIMFSLILCVLGCFFFSQSDSVATSIMGRVLMGMGSACAYISCAKIGAEWFNSDRFALIAGIGMFMGTVGGSLNAVTSMLVDVFEWRGAMMILGALGVGIFFLALMVMSDSPELANAKKDSRQLQSTKGHTQDSLLDGLKIATSNPQNWLIGIYGCVMYLPLCAFAELWGVPYLKLLYGIDSTIASSACVSVFIGMGLGSILGAWISNKIQSRTRVMGLAALGTLACFAVVFYVPGLSFTTMRVVLFLGGLLSGGQTLYFVSVKENMPLRYAATAIGFTNAFVMSSAILFQPLLGYLLDLTWDGVKGIDGVPVYSIENYKVAFSAVMVAFLVGWIVMLFVRDTYKKVSNEA